MLIVAEFALMPLKFVEITLEFIAILKEFAPILAEFAEMFYVFAPIAMTTDVRSVEPLPLNPAPYAIAAKFVLIATEF